MNSGKGQAQMTGVSRILFSAALLCLSSTAMARPPTLPATLDADLSSDRDRLIQRIVRGEDYEKSVERYGEVLGEHILRRLVAYGHEELLGPRYPSAEFLVGEECMLSADPKRPPSARATSSLRADWGRVVLTREIKVPGPHPFDPEQALTLYRIEGARHGYTVPSDYRSTLHTNRPLLASVGDLVLVCSSDSLHFERGESSPYPLEFRDNILSSGFAVRLKEPPLVVKKAELDPLHLPGSSALSSVAESGRWPYADHQTFVNRMLIKRDLGGVGPVHRYAVFADQREVILEVPASLKNRELVKPVRYVWVITGPPRIDIAQKQVTFVAQDIEGRYIKTDE